MITYVLSKTFTRKVPLLASWCPKVLDETSQYGSLHHLTRIFLKSKMHSSSLEWWTSLLFFWWTYQVVIFICALWIRIALIHTKIAWILLWRICSNCCPIIIYYFLPNSYLIPTIRQNKYLLNKLWWSQFRDRSCHQWDVLILIKSRRHNEWSMIDLWVWSNILVISNKEKMKSMHKLCKSWKFSWFRIFAMKIEFFIKNILL